MPGTETNYFSQESTIPFKAVMSKYDKMDTNEYPNIFGSHIMYQTNIRIYLDATNLPNKYLNIFVRWK